MASTVAIPQRVLEPGKTCWQLAHARRLAFLIDGESYFGALDEALSDVQRSIDILAWDIDRRVRLRPEQPVSLGARLDALCRERPELRVHVLCWDAALVYAFERRWLASQRWRLESHGCVRFHSDGNHPPGAAHHEKVVVIDDVLAFLGGIDLTGHRWDTTAHAPGDERRALPNGTRYGPMHDVQCVVEGEAARRLGERARMRWEIATGEARPAAPQRQGAPWPRSVRPWVEDVEVALLRTQTQHGAMASSREIEAFNERALHGARRHVFIETMYLTARSVARALVELLRMPDGPEITVVLSHHSEGWLEQQTMDTRRSEVLAALRDADRHGRLGVYFPTLGAGKPKITVHSKVLVIDDAIGRVGSSNMTNRSVALDTECDLALEAGARTDACDALQRLRQTLLAEHLGVRRAELRAAERECGSINEAIAALARDADHRTLAPLETAEPLEVVLGSAAADIADPTVPIDGHLVLEQLVEPVHRGRLPRRAMALGAIIAVVLTSAALWYLSDFGEVAGEALKTWLWSAPRSPLGVASVVLAFGVLTTIGIPVTVAIGACAITLGPWLGFGVALTGTYLSAAIGYTVGRLLGADLAARLTSKRAQAVQAALHKRGALSTLVLRIVPVAPFAIINLAAGACRVRPRDYAIGTVIGMTPGILGLSVLIDRIVAALRNPDPLSIVALVVTLVATLAVLAALVKWARRRSGDSLPSVS